jgi:hypothetical protein
MKVLCAVACVASLTCQSAEANKWKLVGTYEVAQGGGEASVWVDQTTVRRERGMARAWVMTSFEEHQVGNWDAEPGISKAYMSFLQFTLTDCKTLDAAYGSWVARDAKMGGGSVVRSASYPTPKTADAPVIPGSIGEMISKTVCGTR